MRMSDCPDISPWLIIVSLTCTVWYIAILAFSLLGYYPIWTYCSELPGKSGLSECINAPHVTVIRPVKGLDPFLGQCLSSTFIQVYPADRITVCLCIPSRDDPGYPTLLRMKAAFPKADLRIYLQDEDPLQNTLGPNPKIRNISRAYREASSDIIWILDCNVWIEKGVCGRMVDKLCGTRGILNQSYRLVHHLPLGISARLFVGLQQEWEAWRQAGIRKRYKQPKRNSKPPNRHETGELKIGVPGDKYGNILEEVFLLCNSSTVHIALNTMLKFPCVTGKSCMFRRSHLDRVTALRSEIGSSYRSGIDYLSNYICEDYMLGMLLGRRSQCGGETAGARIDQSAMIFGDLVVQPLANMSVSDHVARRVRWLRARKISAPFGVLIDPIADSVLWSLYGAYGLTKTLEYLLCYCQTTLADYINTRSVFLACFTLSLAFRAVSSWIMYLKLCPPSPSKHNTTVEYLEPFHGSRLSRRPFLQWLAAWLGRELLAFPTWVWGICGVTVTWRDQHFQVGSDTRIRQLS